MKPFLEVLEKRGAKKGIKGRRNSAQPRIDEETLGLVQGKYFREALESSKINVLLRN